MNNLYIALLGISFVIFLVLFLLGDIRRICYSISVISPFDGIFTALFGVIGNIVTIVIIFPLFFSGGFKKISAIFWGTRYQKMIALYLLLNIPSHIVLMSKSLIFGISMYAQKIILFLLIGIIADTMRHSKNLFTPFRLLVISMSLFIAFSVYELYSGQTIIPGLKVKYSKEMLYEKKLDQHSKNAVSSTRLKGMSQTVTTNRLSMWLQVPLFLSIAMAYRNLNFRKNWVSILCVIVLIFGLIATISRAAILGFVSGMGIATLLIFSSNPKKMIASSVIVVILVISIFSITSRYYNYDMLSSRFSKDSQETDSQLRYSRWEFAIKLFLASPILGAGVGQFEPLSMIDDSEAAPDAHNAFLLMIAEQGLLVFIPFMFVLWQTLNLLLKSRISITTQYWAPFFIGAYFAVIIIDVFNSYFFERIPWFIFAFAIYIDSQLHDPIQHPTKIRPKVLFQPV
jgi:cell division protein FtsL